MLTRSSREKGSRPPASLWGQGVYVHGVLGGGVRV